MDNVCKKCNQRSSGFMIFNFAGVVRALVLVLLTCCIYSASPAGFFAVAAAAQEPGGKSNQYVTIDFNDVDINLFIKYISELTGKNFIVDRTVKGKVTIISPTRISEEDAYHVFESVLEVHGYTTVPSGSVIKIIPSVQARSKSIATIRDNELRYPEDKVVTQLINLSHTNPADVKKILAPLVSKTSVVIAHTDSGMLIITDVLSNINRLQEIIEAIDVPSVGEELIVLPLEHASADTIGKSLMQLFQRTAAKGARRIEVVKIIPYERTNSLIIFASKVNIQKIKDLLTQIDTEMPRGAGNIQVYYLQHANSEELIKVLTNLPGDAPVTDKKTKATARKAPPISKNVKIMSDPETNSLIIIAPRDEYLVLEDVIKKLDIPRRMVYLEALIMEVSVTKEFQFGVEWGGGGEFDDGTGKVLGGFSGSNPAYSTMQGLTASPPVMPGGFTVGVLKQGGEDRQCFFP